jgi:hypothetical protein
MLPGELSMPFSLIPTALGVCFLLVWTFIGGMMFRDGQLATREERESDVRILPLPISKQRKGAA